MSFTGKHQALHDMLTDASVRILDETKAQPRHYTLGRP
jgi:hypothetical protein